MTDEKDDIIVNSILKEVIKEIGFEGNISKSTKDFYTDTIRLTIRKTRQKTIETIFTDVIWNNSSCNCPERQIIDAHIKDIKKKLLEKLKDV